MIVRMIFVLLCVCLACSVVSADVYKWVDENGKVRFSDKQPKENSAEKIDEALKKTNVDSASAQMGYSVTAKSGKTEDEKALERKKLEQLEAAIGKPCKKMKSDIAAIARGDRGSFIDENGQEELVLERDRGAKLEEWKDNYRKYGCEKLYPLE
jgi:Na+-transporting NADH:ubiquinone oxidoreductase subunit NqrC